MTPGELEIGAFSLLAWLVMMAAWSLLGLASDLIGPLFGSSGWRRGGRP